MFDLRMFIGGVRRYAVVAVLYLQQHWTSLSFYGPFRDAVELEEDRTFLSHARKVQCAAVAVMAEADWIALLHDRIVLNFIFGPLRRLEVIRKTERLVLHTYSAGCWIADPA